MVVGGAVEGLKSEMLQDDADNAQQVLGFGFPYIRSRALKLHTTGYAHRSVKARFRPSLSCNCL